LTPRPSRLHWLALLVAVAGLDLSLTFHNLWPTPWVTTRHELSLEVAVLLLAMALYARWRPALSGTAVNVLAALLTIACIGRYAQVTADALYGRPVDLYWDARHLPRVAAMLAEAAQASAELVVAALLHDVGHLLHDLPDEAPDEGVDDCHETAGCNYLRKLYPEAVTEPIRLHVPAKRCLCAVEPDYLQQLSEPSMVSLQLQGGPMSDDEVERFMMSPYAEDALRLRRWDDLAKDAERRTPSLAHYADLLRRTASGETPL